MSGGSGFASWIEAHPEIASVLVGVCDLNGAMRGKRIDPTKVASLDAGSIRMPLSVTTVDIWGRDIEGNRLVFETGDADGYCEATDRGILPISWTHEPSAFVQLWMTEEDGTPFMADPRRILGEVVEKYRARGLTPVVATELEFYLTDPSGPVPDRPMNPKTGQRVERYDAMALDDLGDFEPFLNDVYAACRAQGVPADTTISETGAGQLELNLVHVDDPLRAADDALLFKRLVRGLARKHGFAATFMAKPFGDSAGSGLHVHFSLLDEFGRNVFDDGGAKGTQTLHHAIGGLLSCMPECALVFAPHQNSFRRLMPGAHAPNGIAWAYENRTAAVRVPAGSHKARRLEHRVAGADSNPYLVLAAILGGALIGIEDQVAPPDPVTGDAYSLDLPRLPETWSAAIDRFEASDRVDRIFGDTLRTIFVQMKRQELQRFQQEVTEFEYRSYLDVV